MKVILFNDTSHYHAGCHYAMHYLHQQINKNHTLLESVKCQEPPIYNPDNLVNADAVIINGEGTMHHDAPLARWYLDLILKVASLKKKIFLINTVWQEMTLSSHLIKILQNSYISVRDIKSKYELQKHNIKAHVHLDLSYNHLGGFPYAGRSGLVIGTFSSPEDQRQKDIPSVNIFKDEWDDIIDTLSKTRYFITSRHHEMYAACLARCPFYVFKGNSWKNEGLLETMACELALGPKFPFPFNKEDDCVVNFMEGKENASVFSSHVEDIEAALPEFNKLFDWMDKQEPLRL